MSWFEIIGWVIAFTVATSLFYRKGVKAGLKHAILILDLNQEQINKLSDELKRDIHDVANDTVKEIKYN